MFFFFQAEDGIRDLVRSRGLGDVYKRQAETASRTPHPGHGPRVAGGALGCGDASDDPGLTLSLIHI